MRALLIALVCLACNLPAHAASTLWEVHGRHNTVYFLGSIHVLRPGDYPLAPAVLHAYADSKRLVMEINLADMDSEQVQTEMLGSAMLSGDRTLPEILGSKRYARAADLAREVGVELATFDQFAPWFAAEAISEIQLSQLGFQAQSGVEMYFLDRARTDGKSISGLETVHDQIALFEGLTMDAQANYLVSSLEQARALPQEVNAMVRAWQHGDTAWFEHELTSEFGQDPALYQSVLAARNRKWLPRLETLLDESENTLVIVGTGHLIGPNSVIDLLKKDGVSAVQR